MTQPRSAARTRLAMGRRARQAAVIVTAGALTALGVGLLVGVGVGLLLAPKPGAELRNDLRDKLRSAQDALPDQLKGGTASTGASSTRSAP